MMCCCASTRDRPRSRIQPALDWTKRTHIPPNSPHSTIQPPKSLYIAPDGPKQSLTVEFDRTPTTSLAYKLPECKQNEFQKSTTPEPESTAAATTAICTSSTDETPDVDDAKWYTSTCNSGCTADGGHGNVSRLALQSELESPATPRPEYCLDFLSV